MNKKDYLIKNRPPYLNVKFLSKEEIFSSLGFSYGEEAIIYLHDKYQYSYEISKEILSNLNFIKKYNEKLNKLYDYYEELKNQNLLKFNYLFKDLLINKKIYIFGYSKLDTELISLLNNPTFIEEKQNTKSISISFEFLKIKKTIVSKNPIKYTCKGSKKNACRTVP